MASDHQRNHPVFVAMVGSLASVGAALSYNDAEDGLHVVGESLARAATVPTHLVHSEPRKALQQARDFLWWMQGNEPPEWLPERWREQVLRAVPEEVDEW